jgi:RNA polymerase sigma factor (sigma-70 family)
MNAPLFEEIFKQYNVYLYNIAYKLTSDREKAEDLAQETFLRAFEKIDQLKNADSGKYWIRKICLNLFLMDKRAQKIQVIENSVPHDGNDTALEKLLRDESPSALDEVIVDEFVRELQNGCFLAMSRRLTLEQRAVFSLHDMFGLPLDEIAGLLEITTGAAKALLHRARKNLFNFFSDHCEWVDPANTCKCHAWQKFKSDREALKAEVAKREKDLSFCDEPADRGIPSFKKRRILFLYRNIPDYKPSVEWYKKVVSAVKK